jgi:hypothetical protein
MVRKDRTFIDAIKSYYASDIKDTEKHDTEVEHMYYIEKLRHLLVMERDSKRFKVYNARTGKWIQNVPGININHLSLIRKKCWKWWCSDSS